MGSEIHKLLKEAIEMFYAKDAEKLLKGGRRRASERCIVNCIARYLWFLLQQRNIEADVDVEYNLDNKNNDIKRIHSGECANNNCEGCWMHEYANGRIKRSFDDDLKEFDKSYVYPDLIVHKRGKGNNYLAVEFKMEETAIKDASKLSKCVNRYTNGALWDFAKLQYFACTTRMDGFKCYDKVAFVILKPDEAEYILPEHFPNLSNGNGSRTV